MKLKDTKIKVGDNVRWEILIDKHRGSIRMGRGVVTDLKGRNICINGVWKWLPDFDKIEVSKER